MHDLPKTLLLIALSITSTEALCAAEGDCGDSGANWIQTSPSDPKPGEAIRIKALSIESSLTALSLETDQGIKQLPARSGDGPPYSLDSEVQIPLTGETRIIASREGAVVACRNVGRTGASNESPREWTQSMEVFYAGWIAQLFDGPPDEELSFRSLEPVLRDPERNFLYN